MSRVFPSVVVIAFATLLSCGDGGGGGDAGVDAPTAEGTLELSWEIRDGDRVVSCAEVGATVVRVSALPVVGGFATIDSLPCTSAGATTRGFAAGLYDVTLELRASGNRTLGAPVVQRQVEIVRGTSKSLGQVMFEVAARGSFEFSFDVSDERPTCAAADAGGAGVDEVLFELRNANDDCVPADFAVDGADTYTVDCQTRFRCIDSTQTITVTGVPSGPYQLRLTAFTEGLACYASTVLFTVAGGNSSESLGTQTAALDSSVPGCDPAGDMADAGP